MILKAGEKEGLVQDIEQFKAAQQRYRKLGVPYHRGYLFYGPPGSGKTSIVSALAGHFGISIYAINLTDFNDKSLLKAINDVPTKSLILFEDIDCMKTGKARPDEEGAAKEARAPNGSTESQDRLGVTLSGLLNVLDGFSAPENMLFVMTTNKIDVLDRALLRPGRIDYKLFFGDVLEEQKIELYRRFFPQASEFEARWFVETHEPAETMAEFQGLLLDLGNLPPVPLKVSCKNSDISSSTPNLTNFCERTLTAYCVSKPCLDLSSVRRRSTSVSRSRRARRSLAFSLKSSTSALAMASVWLTRSCRRSKAALLELSPIADCARAALPERGDAAAMTREEEITLGFCFVELLFQLDERVFQSFHL